MRWLDSVPDDPDYAGSQASYLATIGVPTAWDVTQGSDDVVVAVLDSGVDATHPDLAGRLVAGTDIVNHDDDTSDDRGHGTKMAGVIAAVANNRQGIAGVAWSGKVMPVKVTNASGAATDTNVVAGMIWAVDHGAKVISLSLGAPGDDSALQRGVDYARAHDVLTVAAAGNSATDVPEYPAACRGVVAVGATDTAGRRTKFSNWGRWVDVSAPGVDILTTTAKPAQGYGLSTGTSIATALVAGVAVLVRAAHPKASQAQVADLLRRSARGRGPVGADGLDASGVVDAAAAAQLPPRPAPPDTLRASSAASGPTRTGYWMLDATGAVDAFGDAAYKGDAWGDLPRGGAVHLEPTPSGAGYWLLDAAGRVFPTGDATDLGGITLDRLRSGERATAMAAIPGGGGYWVFTDVGRVFAFGAAPSTLGDLAAIRLNRPIVDAVGTRSGKGYLMVADDGGIFAFGDARFAGSMGGRHLNAPIGALAPDSDGDGYWLTARDGGVFAFDAPFRGSLGSTHLNAPIAGMAACGDGYLLASSDGGVFDYSNCPFAGSLGDHPPASPIVALSALP